MTYSLARYRGAQHSTSHELEAPSAVQLMRDWATAYPQQLLLLRDDNGEAVAYKRPLASTTAEACGSRYAHP